MVKDIKNLIFISVMLLGGIAAWPNSPVACNRESICTIYRKLKNDDGKTISIPYSFKFQPPKGGSPTVVFIPGGPGQSSIQLNVRTFLHLPDDFGIIQTDPMFVGANKHPDAASFKGATNSIQVARDIQLALESVDAKNVIIYGSSYGTVPATILAARLSKIGEAPRAVVLDGVVARAISIEEAKLGYLEQWQRIKNQVGSSAVVAFDRTAIRWKEDGVLNEKELSKILIYLLFFSSDKLALALSAIEQGDAMWAQQLFTYTKSKVGISYEEDEIWFQGVISCRELFPDSNPDVDPFEYDFQGNLELAPVGNVCEKYKGKRPVDLYDSKQHQIKAPVIYLQGEYDPAISLWQVKYHSYNQKSLHKDIVIVPKGHHISLMTSLNRCNSDFFKELQRNPKTAKRALEPCRLGQQHF